MDGDRFGLGVSPKRREDARFLIGKGAYLDDLVFPNVAHAIFVRSPHAHAGIVSVDATEARVAPGVLAVLTAADLAADGLNDLPPTVEANPQTGLLMESLMATVAQSDKEAKTRIRAFLDRKTAKVKPS